MGGKKIKSCEADKAQRLSLAELAAHDDVCSDVLIDNVGCFLDLPDVFFAYTSL